MDHMLILNSQSFILFICFMYYIYFKGIVKYNVLHVTISVELLYYCITS